MKMNWYGKANRIFGDWCSALSLVFATYVLSFVLQAGGVSPLLSTFIVDIVVGTIGFLIYRKMMNKPEFQPSQSANKKALILALCIFLPLIYYFLNLSLWCVNVLFVNDEGMAQHVAAATSYPLWFQILSLTIIAPVYEEITMRLFSYNWMKSSTNWIVSMIVTSLVFAFMHGTKTHMLTATIFGIVMVLIHELTGVWWSSIVAHILYNTMTIFLSDKDIFVYNNVTIILISLIVICGIAFATAYVDKLRKLKAKNS